MTSAAPSAAPTVMGEAMIPPPLHLRLPYSKSDAYENDRNRLPNYIYERWKRRAGGINRSVAGSGEGGIYHPTCPGLPLLSPLLTTAYESFFVPGSSFRTPFTCLLDAAEPVWVLAFSVTVWRHPQTAKRYHARPHCGNSYTVGSAVTHIVKSYDLPYLQKTSGQTHVSGAG